MPYNTIKELGLKTTKELDECSDQIAENQSINNHLVLQRDEFLNYYIKGQILAMALLKDRIKFTEMQSISRWLHKKHLIDKRDREREIRDAAYLHANLQERELKLNSENDNFKKENTDLDQFAKDGSVIRTNMQRLKDDRDKLKSRLHSTDDDFKELMEQNEKLLKEVEEAEKKAGVTKQAGGNPKYVNAPTMRKPKPAAPIDEIVIEETEQQREKRLKLERLSKLNQGAGLR